MVLVGDCGWVDVVWVFCIIIIIINPDGGFPCKTGKTCNVYKQVYINITKSTKLS